MAWQSGGTTRTSTTAYKQHRERMKTELDYQCQDAHRGPCAGNLELDHIVPHAEGGTDTPSNLQWRCKRHHAMKSQREAQRGRQRRRSRGSFETEAHPGIMG